MRSRLVLDGDRITFGASTRTYIFESLTEKEEDKALTGKTVAADEAELMQQLPMSFGGKQGRARGAQQQQGTEAPKANDSAAEARKKVCMIWSLSRCSLWWLHGADLRLLALLSDSEKRRSRR